MTRPMWITVDTFSKVFLPVGTLLLSVAVFVGTRTAAVAESRSVAKTQCREGTIGLLTEAESFIVKSTEQPAAQTGQNAPAQPSAGLLARANGINDQLTARGQKIDVAAKFLDQNCQDAGIVIPLNVQRSLCTVAALTPDNDVKAGLIETADSIAARAGQPNANCGARPPGAVASNGASSANPANAIVNNNGPVPAPPPPPRTPIRLFIQYPRDAGPGAADALRQAINTSGLAGRKVIVPPAEAMAVRIDYSSLRCLKSVDCAHAQPIVASINTLLGRPAVRLLDLSARYDSRSDVRAGDYELWLTANDLTPTGKNEPLQTHD